MNVIIKISHETILSLRKDKLEFTSNNKIVVSKESFQYKNKIKSYIEFKYKQSRGYACFCENK